jgi:hypothetical protein
MTKQTKLAAFTILTDDAYQGANAWACGQQPSISSNDEFDVIVAAPDHGRRSGAMVSVVRFSDEGTQEWVRSLMVSGREEGEMWVERWIGNISRATGGQLAAFGFTRIV